MMKMQSLLRGVMTIHSVRSHVQSGIVNNVNHNVLPSANSSLPQPLLQHVRTTYILRRKKKLELTKTHKPVGSRKLKDDHFIYELVENTIAKKKEPLKVLLKTSVEGLGLKGEVVELSPHKARRDLLLPGLATYPTPENLEKYSSPETDTSLQDQPSSPFALSTARLLSEMIIGVNMNMYKPWVIEPWHVRVAFRKAGVIVPESAITMPPQPISGPDLTLQGKLFAVKIKINNKEEAAVRCRIGHFTPDPLQRMPLPPQVWNLPVEPVFPDQLPLLEELTNMDPRRQVTKDEEEEYI